MTTVLSEPFTAPTAPTPKRRVLNHYVRSSAIIAGIVHGTPATALCGDQFVPRSNGHGGVAVSGAAMCPRCSTIYDGLSR